MTRARSFFVVSAVVAMTAGCQWVLPIHEGHEGPASNEDGGAVSEAGAASREAGGAVNEAGGAASDATKDAMTPEATTPEGGSPVSCNQAYDPKPACNQCLNEQCCALLDRCLRGNAECEALAECAANCLSDSCVTGCATKHPSGKSDFEAADRCTANACASACGGG